MKYYQTVLNYSFTINVKNINCDVYLLCYVSIIRSPVFFYLYKCKLY